MEIKTYNGVVARYYSDLMYVKYEDPYCWLFFADDDKYKVEVSIKYLFENLPQKPFFRCNRTSIINICYYAEFDKYLSQLIMDDGTKFELSFRKDEKFKTQKADLKRISPPCPLCVSCKNEKCSDFWLFCLSSNQKTEDMKDGIP